MQKLFHHVRIKEENNKEAISMVNVLWMKENPPFPNHPLPVIYYPGALKEVVENCSDSGEKVKVFFEKNNYTNSWMNGIHDYHHFHSNTHEVLGCVSGEATVMLGGPHSEEITITKGDVILLPAGVAHKCTRSLIREEQ